MTTAHAAVDFQSPLYLSDWTGRYTTKRSPGISGTVVASIACINGSPRRLSRTGVLVDCIARAIQARVTARRHDIAFADAGASVMSGVDRASLSPMGESVCRMVEGADILIVASPVYRASYSGLMKHLFDLVDRDAMRGKLAVLAATGGTPLHGLVLEHQTRPLMGFFGIQTVATALYGLEHEIDLRGYVAAALAARIEVAADEVAELFHGSRRSTPDISTAA